MNKSEAAIVAALGALAGAALVYVLLGRRRGPGYIPTVGQPPVPDNPSPGANSQITWTVHGKATADDKVMFSCYADEGGTVSVLTPNPLPVSEGTGDVQFTTQLSKAAGRVHASAVGVASCECTTEAVLAIRVVPPVKP